MKILLILTLFFAASNIGCSKVIVRKFQDRRYHKCTAKELKSEEKPVGKFCFKACVKYKFLHKKTPENCKSWYKSTLDTKNEKDWDKIDGFILIGEHRT